MTTRELWFTDNGRDWLGDDAPPRVARPPGLAHERVGCHQREQLLVAAAVVILSRRAQEPEGQHRYARRAVWSLFLALTGYLVLVSLMTSIVRIPVLIRLAPYRIGSLVVALSWCLLGAELLKRWRWRSLIWAVGFAATTLMLVWALI